MLTLQQQTVSPFRAFPVPALLPPVLCRGRGGVPLSAVSRGEPEGAGHHPAAGAEC